MFATLFLGVVLAVFLTLGVVSGDAERGLLQPLVVRPISRSTLLLSRFLGAAVVCVAYVLAVYGIAVAIIGLTGHWWPAVRAGPGLELAGGVVIVIALSLLGSVFLSSTANGIAVFMLFGAGLVAGLLGDDRPRAQLARRSSTPPTIAAWALPFEALYQDGLRMITEQRDRRHRLPAPARPVRRRVRPRLGDPRLGGRLPLHSARPSAVRVLAPRSLTRREVVNRSK